MTTYIQPQPALYLPPRTRNNSQTNAAGQVSLKRSLPLRIDWPMLCASLLICVCLLGVMWIFSQSWEVSVVSFSEPQTPFLRGSY